MRNINRKFILGVCIISALGGLLFGYDWVVIGGAKPFYEAYFSIMDDPGMQGLAMSIALVGCLAGAMVCGGLANRMGRKPLLILSAVLFLASAYVTGAVDDFNMFLLARLLGGVGIGLASALSPMYIAEISPASLRGRLVSLNQLTIVLGILGAQIVNMLIAEDVPEGFSTTEIISSWNGQWGWRWMFWAEAYPAAAFLILAFFIPESPRWLVMKGYIDRARKILVKIGGAEYSDKEISEIGKAIESEEGQAGLETLFTRPFRKVLVLGLVIAFFQQWCGTNVIFNYAQEIFSEAGYELGDLFFQIVVTGITNVIFTFVAIYTVDRFGRRFLMLLGAGGLGAIYLILGGCYTFEVHGVLMTVLVVLAIACYAMTLGPVTWVLLSEIFPDKIRAVAMATCTFLLWVGSATLTFTFPYMNTFLGAGFTFWIYSTICICAFIFLYFRCPETKGRSLEELQRKLVRSDK